MTGAKRSSITSFTRQARSRMVRTLCELDYSPLFKDGNRPAMVTLTLPGAWEVIAPTVQDFKAAIGRFRAHYLHSWGSSMAAVWKMEFQRRGAPHLHLLTTPPTGKARGTGETFKEWLGRAWAGACRTADLLGPLEAEKHVRAGTGIDYDPRGNWIDAKRIAIYYAKHGLYGSKEYQNQAPQLWIDAGSVGRFWGYWGLKKGGRTIEVDTETVGVQLGPDPEVFRAVQKCREAGLEVTVPLLEHIEKQIIVTSPWSAPEPGWRLFVRAILPPQTNSRRPSACANRCALVSAHSLACASRPAASLSTRARLTAR
ncbi:rolling circle replication-associated protein [Leucobacter sp. HY1910]